MDEKSFIEKYLRPLAASNEIAFSFKDDCCLLPKENYILTSDTIVSGSHFFPNDCPESIAHKLIHVNISDLVAKASYPKFYNLNITIPPEISEEWLKIFCAKLHEIQKQYNFSLVGGDTTYGPNLVLSASFFGVAATNIPTTNKAELGDDIYVSGTIGDSYIGLLTKRKEIESTKYFEDKYLFPIARIDLIETIQKYAKASTDISDGLLQDLKLILKASNVGAEINLPTNLFKTESLKQPIESLIKAGDDYQIIMTSHSKNRKHIEDNSDFKFIGKITKSGLQTKY